LKAFSVTLDRATLHRTAIGGGKPVSQRFVSQLVVLALLVVTFGGLARASGTRVSAFPGANGLIAFNSAGAVYVVKPDGSGLKSIAQTNSSDYSTGVSWSRDGRQIAFSAYRGTDPDIYVVNADGTHQHQLTFSRGVDVDPSWSPDGQHIAFETNRNGNVDIYSMDSHGKHVTPLTNGAENEQDPTWSPDGTKIAYTDEAVGAATREIWVMNADGSGKRQLTSAPNFSENPNWSPDGTHLVFDSDRLVKGDLDLYSMAADGSSVKRLTSSPALDALPAYSPDGKQIVFVSDRVQKDSRRLFVMPVAGGKPRQVIAGDQPEFQMVPDWQRIRTGVLDKPARPPGALLARAGVTSTVDPLYDLDDAWSVPMTAGVTYRVNLTPSHGCAGVALYGPGVRNFTVARPLMTESCGGYFTYTPGPNKNGTYTIRVTAQTNTDAIVSYRLQAAPAGPDDQGPGVPLADGQTRTGSVTGRGVDVVDLYRFQILHPSVVRIGLASGAALSLTLTSLSGSQLAATQAGTDLVKTFGAGTYLATVKAPGHVAGSYRLSLLVRAVTKTTLTVGRARHVTIPVGQSVVLTTSTSPAPTGGQVAIRLDYDDPLSGWVFRKLWEVAPQASVTFTPPSVGTWRVIASFRGTRSSNPSRSDYTTIVVT
jgi:hypothetical protein